MNVADFLYHEAELLDERRFEDWLALYAADAWYWMPILPPERAEAPSAAERAADLVLCDDDRPMMEARIRRLKMDRAFTEQPPRRICRFISNVAEEGREGEALRVRSKLFVHGYRVREQARDEEVFFSATVRHWLRPREGAFVIAAKRVDLINSEASLRVMPEPF